MGCISMLYGGVDISIHAPREGSDRYADLSHYQTPYFYPRSPRGERPEKVAVGEITLKFLSTLPARGATSAYSITVSALDLFLSTLPARGATRWCTAQSCSP